MPPASSTPSSGRSTPCPLSDERSYCGGSETSGNRTTGRGCDVQRRNTTEDGSRLRNGGSVGRGGLGRALIRAGHDRARDMGHDYSVVSGDRSALLRTVGLRKCPQLRSCSAVRRAVRILYVLPSAGGGRAGLRGRSICRGILLTGHEAAGPSCIVHLTRAAFAWRRPLCASFASGCADGALCRNRPMRNRFRRARCREE